MRTFIGPDIILSDLTEGPTLFAQSEVRLYSVLDTVVISGEDVWYSSWFVCV